MVSYTQFRVVEKYAVFQPLSFDSGALFVSAAYYATDHPILRCLSTQV